MLLMMEEFLKHGTPTVRQVKMLTKFIIHFINTINETCKRSAGEGTNLLKNHLFFHLSLYINYYGPPNGFDSGPSESHHKTEIKAPSKCTQRRASLLIIQTANRIMENKLLDRVAQQFSRKENTRNTLKHKIAGSLFWIRYDPNGIPTMIYDKKSNQGNCLHPHLILEFCCNKVLPLLRDQSKGILGFTEHNRKDMYDKEKNYLFRSHPSYRMSKNSVGRSSNGWYDWAIFDLGEDGPIPCQILCFVQLNDLSIPYGTVSGFYIDSPGTYCIVRRFETTPTTGRYSQFTRSGKLKSDLYLFSTESILSEVAVIPDVMCNGGLDESFFVIANRDSWLTKFYNSMERIDGKTFGELYAGQEIDIAHLGYTA